MGSAVQEIRSRSRFTVLYALMGGPGTRTELARATGLSLATVAAVSAELIDVGLVEVVAVERSGRGRPRERLGLARSRGRLVGVDVAETYVAVTVFDLGLGRAAGLRHALLQASPTPEQVAAAVATAVAAAVAQIEGGEVLRIGVSLPGVVDPATGTSVFAPNWGWREVAIRSLLGAALTARLGREVAVDVDNPLMAATTAELWFGVGREVDSFAVVNLGTGVGAGLVVQRALVRGASNSAGEWGHTTLMLGGRGCGCGRTGCVESYLGVAGLAATLAEVDTGRDPDGQQPPPQDQTAFVAGLAAALAAGDPAAVAAVRLTGHRLAAAVGNLVNLLDPQAVAVTGWVADALAPWLLADLPQEVAAQSLPSSGAAVAVGRTQVDGNVVTLGMATIALERYLADAGIGRRHTGP